MTNSLKRAFLICTTASAILLSGCAYDRYAYSAGGDVAYGVPVYYDGFYGPYWDGYWGPDGFFYFYDNVGRRYHRDDGHHFRRDAANGYHSVAPRTAGGGFRSPLSGAAPRVELDGAMRERRG